MKLFRNAGIKEMSRSKKTAVRLLCLTVCLLLAVSCSVTGFAAQNEETELIVGGSLFGIKMQTKGVAVVGLDKVTTENGSLSPAYDAGIKINDAIISINGTGVTTVKSVTAMIEKSNGKALEISILRKGSVKNVKLTPALGKDGKYHIGIWIRDSAAGIGTVTYIDPKTNEFAGLGHGICDGSTGELLQLSRGTVSEVELAGIVKGRAGCPGEIKGAFKGGKKGAVITNKASGVYGVYSSLPVGVSEKMIIARLDEITSGEATVRCSVSGQIADYKIRITKIDPKNENGKNFTINVTDPALIKLTGGIVQGMSGSPIIQNGKLIGAVTHVTVNDPTKGYGIFIGNMLNQMGDLAS